MAKRQLVVLVVFIALEVVGFAFFRMNPSGPRAWIAPVLMTTALVGFMVWIYRESRRDRPRP